MVDTNPTEDHSPGRWYVSPLRVRVDERVGELQGRSSCGDAASVRCQHVPHPRRHPVGQGEQIAVLMPKDIHRCVVLVSGAAPHVVDDCETGHPAGDPRSYSIGDVLVEFGEPAGQRHSEDPNRGRLASVRLRTPMTTEDAVSYVQAELSAKANPDKAARMQAYMKTEMPFYGVQKPGRTEILRYLKREAAPQDREEYQDLATALWELPHREEKYLAQAVAVAFKSFIVPESLPLYERFIVEGAWWDFVDETATHLIRELVLEHPSRIWPVVDEWSQDDNMWLRRTSLTCQIGAKERTDADRLFRFCEMRMHETEFFIRKAIGWALREYAKTDPEAVAAFAREHRESLSGLSFREATKHIGDLVSR